MWYLIVNRTLKSYRLYGPFATQGDANDMGKALAQAYTWVIRYTITQATPISQTPDGGFRMEAVI